MYIKIKLNIMGDSLMIIIFILLMEVFYLSSLNYLKKNRAFLFENHTNFFKLSHNYPFDIDNKNDLKLIKSFKFLK